MGKDEPFVHLAFWFCASTFPLFAHPIAIAIVVPAIRRLQQRKESDKLGH